MNMNIKYNILLSGGVREEAEEREKKTHTKVMENVTRKQVVEE